MGNIVSDIVYVRISNMKNHANNSVAGIVTKTGVHKKLVKMKSCQLTSKVFQYAIQWSRTMDIKKLRDKVEKSWNSLR